MKVRFVYSKAQEIEKLVNLHAEYQWFLKQKFPIYLPQSYDKIYRDTKGNKKLFVQSLGKEMGRVYKREDYAGKQELVKVSWLKVEEEFFEYLLSLNLKVQDKYVCQISLYGPQGQYKYPNTINLRMASRQDLSQANMTIAHEILHLSIYNKVRKLKMLPAQIEGIVDLFFKEMKLQDLFPEYMLQSIGVHDKKLFDKVIKC